MTPADVINSEEVSERVGTMAVIISELFAVGVGLMWVAVEVRRREQRTTAHIEEAISGGLLAPTLELQAPFAQRVLQPLARQVLQRLGAIMPGRNVEKLRRQLLVAGSPFGLGPLDFLGLRILVALVGTGLLVVILLSVSGSFGRSLLAGAAAALALSELPNYWLRRRMNRRRHRITLALADALDMLTVCVDAGLGLESSFQRIGQQWDHALAWEFRRAVMEMGVGISWREAMRNMVYRTDVPDLSSLVAVLLQADQLGFSISDTLHAQAEQLRVRRRQRAQELARAAPFKMLFPMVIFIMPATFAVVLGPALSAIIEAFSGI